MITELKTKCPRCERNLAIIPAYQVATILVKRTCRGCGTAWFIKVVPLAFRQQMVMHSLDFTEIITDRQRGQLREAYASLEGATQ